MTSRSGRGGEHNNPAELTETWRIQCALGDKITSKSRGTELARAFCVIRTGHVPPEATLDRTGMSPPPKLGRHYPKSSSYPRITLHYPATRITLRITLRAARSDYPGLPCHPDYPPDYPRSSTVGLPWITLPPGLPSGLP